MTPQTEAEELAAAARALGRDLADIKVEDCRWVRGPARFDYMATWGDYDLDAHIGTGRTPQEATWDLIEATTP